MGGGDAMPRDAWNPAQYHKFRVERALPFWDLIALIQPRRPMRAIDLGCGTGELSAVLAERLDARVDAIDRSPAMLERAADLDAPLVTFRQGDIAAVDDVSAYDLVFSNAALHWVPDNEALLGRLLPQLRPGAQIAVQVPMNTAHPSHAVAAELARDPRFRASFAEPPRSHALPLERYAELLHEHGFVEKVCFEKIYGHELERSADVVEWVKGTLFTAYLPALPDDAARAAFVDAYRERLLAAIGDRSPYFFPFRRLLFWARKRG